MSVLQAQPSLSISTNECKQKFLMNEIQSMKVTKEIYSGIFDELKSMLKKAMTVGQNDKNQKRRKSSDQCDTTQSSPNASLSIEHSKSTQSQQHIKSPSISQINTHINQFTTTLQQKVKQYCSSSISQNIVKYLEIEKEEHEFYPIVIHQLNTFIKTNQKQIAQREKQLQSIEDQKYHKDSNNNKLNKHLQDLQKISSAQKDKKSTQKTISSFDFNKRVMEVLKKQINIQKLKKKNLSLQIEEKKKIHAQKQSKKQNSQNLIHLKNTNKTQFHNTLTGKSEELNGKKLSELKKTNNLFSQQNIQKVANSKNDTSAFEKIVMVYQKQKFLNSRIQQQISKLQKKILSQRQQNHLLGEKTQQLQKQIEKLDWSKVCDSSFAHVNHRKSDRPIQLSILDRTFLKQYDQKSLEFSQISINQSMITKD